MFSRLTFDGFQDIFTVIAFALIAGGFLIFVTRAVFMKKKKAARLAAMPLEEEGKKRTRKNNSDESEKRS